MKIKRNSLSVIVLELFMAAVLLSGFMPATVYAQDEPVYLLFEFMSVDNEQETAYQEVEAFWKRIHEVRVESGEILGWDLWSLQPGGENQGFQYLTVTIFDDRVKMFGDSDIMGHAQKAYPEMSEEELNERFAETGAARDLAVRYYLEYVGGTDGDFEMQTGIVAGMDLMKVAPGSFEEYENAELEIFLPWHQGLIDAGNKGYWELLRIISPTGSDTYATHLTVNMYTGWEQYFSGGGEAPSFADQMMYERGVATRDLKWTYLATLREMVR